MARRWLFSAAKSSHHPAQERFDASREVLQLTQRLDTERDMLATWERRLALRQQWEHDHPGPTQLPELRQVCAQTQLSIQCLERDLLQARTRLRLLEVLG